MLRPARRRPRTRAQPRPERRARQPQAARTILGVIQLTPPAMIAAAKNGQGAAGGWPVPAARAMARASRPVALKRAGASSAPRTRAPESPMTTIAVNRRETPGPVVSAAAIHSAKRAAARQRTRRGVEPAGMTCQPARPDRNLPVAETTPPMAIEPAA